jgi:translation initiation factor 1
MAKRDKIKVVEAGSAAPLAHNPLAALADTGALPHTSAATEHAPEPPRAKAAVGRLVLRRETKQRGGKTVVVVSGFESRPDLDLEALRELAKHLRRELGCGGSLDARAGLHEIVVQGDQAARVAELLRARGFRVVGVTS